MATMRSFSFKSNEPDFPGGPACFLLAGWPTDGDGPLGRGVGPFDDDGLLLEVGVELPYLLLASLNFFHS